MVGSIQSSLKCIFHMIEYFGIDGNRKMTKMDFFPEIKINKKFAFLIEFKKPMKNIFRFDWQKCFHQTKLTSILSLSLILANIYASIKNCSFDDDTKGK